MANFVLLQKYDNHGFTSELYQVSEKTALIEKFTGIYVYEQVDEEGNTMYTVSEEVLSAKEALNIYDTLYESYETKVEAGEVAVNLARMSLLRQRQAFE